ncbi:MAG TPA: hypothetical protein VFZ66_21050 [Herpetosiphonaceae bacterium]
MSGIPIACDLSALSAEQRQRHTALSEQLAQAVQEVRELPDGYAFRYTTNDATWMIAAEYVSLERRCCPFFVFTLMLDADRTVWLHLTGHSEVKAFLTTQIGNQ